MLLLLKTNVEFAQVCRVKAVLKLTPDQEKLWTPLETAVRDAAKMRMEQMKSMMDCQLALNRDPRFAPDRDPLRGHGG